MNVTAFPAGGELATALSDLEAAGIEYTVVCSGPEPACPDLTTLAAA